MKKLMFFVLVLCSVACMAQKNQKGSKKAQTEQKQPEVKLRTLYKNAKTALKNVNGQDAAKQALIGALGRPDLSNKSKAKIYYYAAQLDQSSNSIINQQAFLKQKYDTAALFTTVRNMYDNLLLCDSCDLIPNSHGLIKMKYKDRTREMMLKHRRNLLSGGKFFMRKADYANAYPYFDDYLKSNGNPSDTILPRVNFWATLCGYYLKDPNKTLKYIDAAIVSADSANKPVLQEYKCRQLLAKNDEKGWIEELKTGVEDYPEYDYFFINLMGYYTQHNQYDEGLAFADSLLHFHQQKPMFWYAKSLLSLGKEDFTNCIAFSDQCIQLDPNYADAYYNKGISYCNLALLAQENACTDINNPKMLEDKEKIRNLYSEAKPCMEMVRKLQPDNQKRWAQPLYRIYLNLNLGKEFDEIDKLLNASAAPADGQKAENAPAQEQKKGGKGKK